jgi:hypothetical protein
VEKMTEVTCICRSLKNKAVPCFVLFLIQFDRVFGRFVTRRDQKHDRELFKKVYLGSSQKMWLFFPRFFSLGCFDRFFYRVFLGVSQQGGFKNLIKKIAETFPQPPKKYLLTYVTSVCFNCTQGQSRRGWLVPGLGLVSFFRFF